MRTVGYTATTRFEIDLGEDGKRLSAFRARSPDLGRDGVRPARGASFYGSNDGENRDRLGTSAFQSNDVQTMGTCRPELEEPVDSRYVRTGGGFFFLDELEPEKTDTAALAYQNESVDRTARKALSTGKAVNAAATENAALRASCTLDNCEFDERAPFADTTLFDGEPTGRLFVAYLDGQGNIVDTFMDGFLYCPTGALPSGAAALWAQKRFAASQAEALGMRGKIEQTFCALSDSRYARR